MNKKFFTNEEIQEIIKLYPDHYTADIAKKTGRTVHSIYHVAYKYKLRKSDDFREKDNHARNQKLAISGQKSRFKPGQVPPNKGKPMPEYLRQKVEATFFKKGNLPHNTKHDGHERITKDGYIEIRIKLGQYKLKHRIIWESANGKIPPNMIVSFRDGNKLNTNIENLELISRQDGMMRNSISSYPPELREPVKLIKKIKKIIHEKQN